jgi:uncharacterized metal-binding protein YceD (DUF177 family)
MTPERKRSRAWSFPIVAAEIPQAGRHFELRADEPTRAAVAALADLPAVARLEARFDVRRQGADGLHVTGIVSATVGHICVVSLEPMESEIEEGVDIVFVPEMPHAVSGHAAGVADTEAGPESLVDGRIDLGTLATEFLVLGIDPHPRKPEAVFEHPAVREDADEHPFAALAALKKDAGAER